MPKALFVGGVDHGHVRDVPLDLEGKYPGIVDGYLFWRFEGGTHQWAAYFALGAGQVELEDAVRVAGWPTWGDNDPDGRLTSG